MKIQRTFVKEEAYQKLRNWILDGTLAPGVKVRDKELAEQLGVSRTPIREALLRLEDEGFVQTTPNRATHISPIDFHNTLDLYAIVWTLERLAIEQAMEHLGEKELAKLRTINQHFVEQIEKRDMRGVVDADYNFHQVILACSQNRELQKIIREIKAKLIRIDLYCFENTKDLRASYDEHEKIIEALEDKNLSRALHAVECNWKNSLKRTEVSICTKTS